MNLVVLVPTRARPWNIGRIVDAWWGTGAFEIAQLRFVVDQDDATFPQYQEMAARLPEIVLDVRPKWEQLVPKLNEAAVRVAEKGQYQHIAFMGDDHVPRTPRWAHMLVERHMVTRHGKRDLMQFGRDGFQDSKLPTWWSVHRDWVMALGRMVPAPVEHLYCDNSMKVLAQAAVTDRYNQDILVEHMHPVAGKGRTDSQYSRVNSEQQYARDHRQFTHWMAQGLARDVSLLADAIGG